MEREGKRIRRSVGRSGSADPLDRVWILRELARELGLSQAKEEDGKHIRKVVGRPR